nr:YSIRK-type signal peptide-containing protein [Limosilactobacillus fermentum]
MGQRYTRWSIRRLSIGVVSVLRSPRGSSCSRAWP